MDDSDDYASMNRPAGAKQSGHDWSDDDDDVPIAQLAKKHKKSPAVATDSDDDVLLTDLPKKAVAKATTKGKPAANAKPKAKTTPAKSAAAKKLVTKKTPAKKTTPAKKSPASKAKSPTAKATKGKTPAKKKTPVKKGKKRKKSREQDSADKLVTRSSVLYETKKGEVVQKLLCRWWYAMEWPAKKDLKPAPPSYEALEGYPGVFISVEGDDVGKLLDMRNKSTCPCFTNFSNKSSEELKTLLEVALTKQKEALISHWGEGVDEEANIDRELKWLKSVDPTKVDKAAARALAQARINN